ncbi:MAG TPA: hypothetical protein VNQ52_06325 [Microbacteriaceae bacterium]|nr:hypothetical protein [Microbacteriaceae bacterium]
MRDVENVIRRLRGGDRLSHVTAAQWLGLPLPRSALADRRLHVTSGPGLSQIRARKIVGHRDGGSGVVMVRSVPVSAPERLFLELAEVLGHEDLVVVGDHLVLTPRFRERGRPFTTLDALAAAAAIGSHAKGAPAARRAIARVRPGVESPQESRLRLLLTGAGLPEPVCGYELRGPRGWIGWFDLAWPAHRVLGEYDGDQHRTDPGQYERDRHRDDLALDAGWHPVHVRAAHLRPDARQDTLTRFRRALRV